MLPFAEGDLPSYSERRMADLLAQVENRSATRRRRRRRVIQATAALLFSVIAWARAAPPATAGVHEATSAPVGTLTPEAAPNPITVIRR